VLVGVESRARVVRISSEISEVSDVEVLLYNCKELVEIDTKEVSRSSERYFVRVSRAKETRDECRRLYLLGL
jgi:hypothetical protein